ncbi:MAG TPA: hypothetical protein VLR46_07910 [Candidatus Dormibacteraeota bacterium]|nr:hypothetical protein [Candidatus Dormibacteraeota bacterium]
MRIVVWNARMGFGRKHDALVQLEPDVAIVPECSARIDAATGGSVWVGSIPSKGLSVFAYGDYRVSLDQTYDDSIKEVAPVWVAGPHPFFLLAVWSMPPYGEAVQRALVKYAPMIRSGWTVVAGDFNQNTCFDKPNRARNHSRTVELLNDLGLTSAYHRFSGVNHGAETETTLYWSGRPGDRSVYHIDYCFVPKPWAERLHSVSLGSRAEWGRMSDHVPLVVDVEPT